jgi:hypothetical protein
MSSFRFGFLLEKPLSEGATPHQRHIKTAPSWQVVKQLIPHCRFPFLLSDDMVLFVCCGQGLKWLQRTTHHPVATEDGCPG